MFHLKSKLNQVIKLRMKDVMWILSCFHRNKSGIWGWRSDKTEVVNGFEAKVHRS